MSRVAELMGSWAETLGLDDTDRVRWRALGYLHDALRDESPERLLERVPPVQRRLADSLLHGPAAAEHLRVSGVDDGELLAAVAFHTVGDARFGSMGRALYAADFLEPGRSYLPEWRADLRATMPGELNTVVVEVARARLGHLVEQGARLEPQSVDFWNALALECP